MEGSSQFLRNLVALFASRPKSAAGSTATASTQTNDDLDDDEQLEAPATEDLPTGCRRQEPTRLEETLTDFRIYVVWRVNGSRALSGIHWGEGNSAYLGLLHSAGGLLGKLSFVRVKVKSSSTSWVAEAQRIWASRAGKQGSQITPPVYQWLVLEV